MLAAPPAIGIGKNKGLWDCRRAFPTAPLQIFPISSWSNWWFGVNVSSHAGQVFLSSRVIFFFSQEKKKKKKISLQIMKRWKNLNFFARQEKIGFPSQTAEKKQGISRCYFMEARLVTMSLDEVRCYLLRRGGNRHLEEVHSLQTD